MTSTCVITRVTGKTLNTDTDKYVPIKVTVYTGSCRLLFSSNRVSSREAEGQLRAAQEIQLHLPVNASSGIEVGDVAKITADIDSSLVDREFRVTGLFAQTYATARRVPVESLT